ncbi:MAG TPA: nitroreductase family protein [Acidimicrobiales bacterium]|nr:nitroreductase family protein [Acidimicrobiales bacterium]
MDALEAIWARRSIGRLRDPAPTPDDLQLVLQAAAAAPDHGELRPWRFVVLQGGFKDDFGQLLADALLARCAAEGIVPTAGQLTKERTKLGRAPLVVVVAAVRRSIDTIPWQEQFAAGAAAAQSALIAATALGYGSMWRTGDVAYDDRVKAALGLTPDDAVVGFLYFGTSEIEVGERSRRPDLSGLVEYWTSPPPRSPSAGAP